MEVIRRELLRLSGAAVSATLMSKIAWAQTQAGPKLTQILRKDLENQGMVVQETVVSVVSGGNADPKIASGILVRDYEG